MTINIKKDIETQQAVFLYFKNETCQPCKTLRVKVEALVRDEFPKVQFHVLNVAEYPDLVAEYGILSSPVMLLILDGKEYYRGGIYTSIDELRSTIARYYNMIF